MVVQRAFLCCVVFLFPFLFLGHAFVEAVPRPLSAERSLLPPRAFQAALSRRAEEKLLEAHRFLHGDGARRGPASLQRLRILVQNALKKRASESTGAGVSKGPSIENWKMLRDELAQRVFALLNDLKRGSAGSSLLQDAETASEEASWREGDEESSSFLEENPFLAKNATSAGVLGDEKHEKFVYLPQAPQVPRLGKTTKNGIQFSDPSPQSRPQLVQERGPLFAKNVNPQKPHDFSHKDEGSSSSFIEETSGPRKKVHVEQATDSSAQGVALTQKQYSSSVKQKALPYRVSARYESHRTTRFSAHYRCPGPLLVPRPQGVLEEEPVENSDVVLRGKETRSGGKASQIIAFTDARREFRLLWPQKNGAAWDRLLEPYRVEQQLYERSLASESNSESDSAPKYYAPGLRRVDVHQFYDVKKSASASSGSYQKNLAWRVRSPPADRFLVLKVRPKALKRSRALRRLAQQCCGIVQPTACSCCSLFHDTITNGDKRKEENMETNEKQQTVDDGTLIVDNETGGPSNNSGALSPEEENDDHSLRSSSLLQTDADSRVSTEEEAEKKKRNESQQVASSTSSDPKSAEKATEESEDVQNEHVPISTPAGHQKPGITSAALAHTRRQLRKNADKGARRRVLALRLKAQWRGDKLRSLLKNIRQSVEFEDNQNSALFGKSVKGRKSATMASIPAFLRELKTTLTNAATEEISYGENKHINYEDDAESPSFSSSSSSSSSSFFKKHRTKAVVYPTQVDHMEKLDLEFAYQFRPQDREIFPWPERDPLLNENIRRLAYNVAHDLAYEEESKEAELTSFEELASKSDHKMRGGFSKMKTLGPVTSKNSANTVLHGGRRYSVQLDVTSAAHSGSSLVVADADSSLAQKPSLARFLRACYSSEDSSSERMMAKTNKQAHLNCQKVFARIPELVRRFHLHSMH